MNKIDKIFPRIVTYHDFGQFTQRKSTKPEDREVS